MKLTRSGRPVTKPAKFAEDLSEDSGISNTTFEILSPSSKNTFIVRLPNKNEDQSVFGHNGLGVKSELLNRDQVEYINGGENVNDSMHVDHNNYSDNDYSQTIIYEGGDVPDQNSGGEDLVNSSDDITEFSLTNIPIEMVGNDCKEENSLDGDSNVFQGENRMTLAEQLALIQSGAQIHLQREQNGRQLGSISLGPESEIRDHVISIEENGQITIEQISNDKEFEDNSDSEMPEDPVFIEVTENSSKSPHTPPTFPEWWLRLSSTFLSFLSTGYMVDLWLVCCDGEAIPAHQLIFSHVSSNLRLWLAEARVDTQEEAVTLSLPDWDSDTVGQFVSALYQGQLPPQRDSQKKICELAAIFGIEFGSKTLSKDIVADSSNIVIPKKDKDGNQLVLFSTSAEQTHSPTKSFSLPGLNTVGADERTDVMDQVQLGDQQVQVVQTDSGEILLVTCDGQGESLGMNTQAQLDNLRSQVQYNEGMGLSAPHASDTDAQVGQAFDDEVEKIKAVKIAQIKEQQGKQCPVCYSTAIQHRFNSNSADQKFAYRCCNSDCNTDNLKTARAFNQHMVKHSESVQYEPASRVCPLCFRPRIEHKNRSLSDEEKGNHRGNLYKCCHCAASKLSAKKFFIHMENHVAKKHVCNVCGKGYSYKHLLNEHNWKEHGEGQHIRYPCNWEGCDYSAKYKQTLHTHVMERHHGVKRKHRQEDAYKKINCPTCNKSLKKWYYHQFHKKTCSSGNVIYQCEICGKEGFINAVTLQNHVRTKHSVDRPFNCEYCPAKYATAMSLSGHRSRKHGVNSRGEVVPKKMFPCDHCGKLLTSKMKLQAHIEVIHEGRRDYKCRFCDKTFTSKSNLQIHEGSLHTGVLPYRCEFCQKMFARRSQLAAHREAQHPGHAGPFYVVEDVDSVQVDDIIIPVESVEDGVEISVGVDTVSIMEGVAMA